MSTNIFDKKFDDKPDPTFQGRVKFTFGVSAKVSPYKESKPITAAGELKIWCDDVRDLSIAGKKPPRPPSSTSSTWQKKANWGFAPTTLIRSSFHYPTWEYK